MVRHLAWRKGLAHITKRPTIDFTSDRYRVRCCSFAMDEFRIAAGITDGSIQIWNRRTLVQETVLEEGRRVMMNQPRVLAINNRLVVSQTSTSIIVWDIDQCLPVSGRLSTSLISSDISISFKGQRFGTRIFVTTVPGPEARIPSFSIRNT